MRIRAAAFTLLELAITLAAVAIVAAFATPAYRSQIARGHRIDAMTALYRAAQFVDMQTPAATSLPSGMDQAPPTGTAVYRLRLLPADESNGGYAVAASPVESGPMYDDVCGTFTLDATGIRGNITTNASADSTGDCWGGR
ncbi:type IV pilin protein [Paraburkholderia dinghuensis]|uniref:Prepilin-type N-terminal cleavage/methylation domain-containing protein n=1 Tax=Paraburkholderia dinghuensis TaxID=2305225 RepID=A0A3N6N169_9BURK|nr:type IV pilin protein [Paraburkholderia dinghuensis]RQH09944.1 prepilin-type N-terminal cleavage/methylation domain-containing protein [Paraburkholderia dinghuensis]